MAAQNDLSGDSVDVKYEGVIYAQDSSPETGPPSYLVEAFEMGFGDTKNDVSDMRRLGKKQEFRVGLYHELTFISHVC